MGEEGRGREGRGGEARRRNPAVRGMGKKNVIC